MPSESTDDLLKKIQNMDAEDNALSDKSRKLYESIKAEADTLYESRKMIQKERGEMIASAIALGGIKVLTEDRNLAEAIYDAHWDRGSGSREISKAMNDLIKNVDYLRFSGHYGNNDTEKRVSNFQVAIPRGAEIAKLEKISKIIEPILKIQKEILEDVDSNVMVSILEDSCAYSGIYSIREKNGKYWLSFVVYGRESGDSYEAGSLTDVLKLISKKAAYGATEEYEIANPNQEKDTDSYDY
jgi:hypothetical protein